MNNTDNEKREHVIPKWRPPLSSFEKGEAQVPRKTPFSVNDVTNTAIEQELSAFRKNPTFESACYLLGASVLIGDKGLSHESASFIKEHGSPAEKITELADNVLGIEHIDIAHFHTNLQIAKLKSWLREFPKTSIAWLELGRLYTIKGQREKARRAVVTALSLAPYDRYIVRCGVRFFLHISDYDAAWNYIRRAASMNVRDPWLKATELSVAMLSNNKTPYLKRLLPGGTAGEDPFHYSELHESAGMLELNAGNQTRAKKHFRMAWAKPAESVITHGEWIIRNRLPGLKESTGLDYARSLEALTWVQFYNEDDLIPAIETARLWQEEEPYSRSPFMVGACVAGSAGLHDQEVDFANEGLMANPNDAKLLNSLCYGLLRAGRLLEGKDAMKKWEQVIDDPENDVFYLATTGLMMFKTGKPVEGRKYYQEALLKIKEQRLDQLIGKAHLNLALAEIEASTPEAMKTAEMAMDLSTGNVTPEVRFLRKEVNSKMEKYLLR